MYKFKKIQKYGKCTLIALITGVTLFTGCSFFSTKDENQAGEAPKFRAVAAATANIIPVPVEIAADIQRLTSDENFAPIATNDVQVQNLTIPPKNDKIAQVENKDNLLQNTKIEPKVQPNRRPQGKGETVKYTVKYGDTLMKIAFEKYGDLYRWREIYDANKEKVRNYSFLPIGAVLQIYGVDYVVIERNGKPYLIKRNDTLLKISKGIYGSPSHWKDLWDNNRQMVHDPNKIYSGFTLYYKDQIDNKNLPVQDLSSEKK